MVTKLHSNQRVIRGKCVGCNGESRLPFASCTCGFYVVPIKEWGIKKQKLMSKYVRQVTERRNGNQ